MILRRVIAHFRRQEWTAIALDFLIVVVGVFIGIQVSNWNDARSERDEAIKSVNRVLQDVGVDLRILNEQMEFWAGIIDEGEYALNAPAIEDDDTDTAWRIIRAFYNASHFSPVTIRDAGYQELINSGGFRRIGDEALRNHMQAYYSNLGFIVHSSAPPYRKVVRSHVPFAVDKYLYNECLSIHSGGEHLFLDCPPPETSSDLVSLSKELAGNETIRRELEYALSNANVALSTLELKSSDATAFSAQLQQTLYSSTLSETDK